MGPIRVLAISGSLRELSSNTALLNAAIELAPEGVSITLYRGLADMPHFNPDLEDADLPAVADFRAQLQAADGILVCSPEYAHGVPGSLKNALDWIVGSGELVNKPVAVINASAASHFADASLRETITVMMGVIIPEASVVIALSSRGKMRTAGEILADEKTAGKLRAALGAFITAINGRG